MITRAQRIRLGVFFAVSLGILLVVLVFLVGSSLWEERDTYRVRYKISVSGLEIGAPVKYNGVRVGRVERIQIDPKEVSDTIVSVSLQANTPVKENARAVLNVQGITGLKFIELVGGTSEALKLKPGAEIPAGTSVVDKLTGQAENISIKAELLVDQLLALTAEGNRALVADVLERTGSLMNTIDRMLENNSAEVDRLFSGLALSSNRLAGALEEIHRVAQETREVLAGVHRASDQILEPDRLSQVLNDARAAVADVRRRVGDAELGKVAGLLERLLVRTNALVERLDLIVERGNEDIRASLRYLAETTENLRDFSRLIREDPTRLLKSQERRERPLP